MKKFNDIKKICLIGNCSYGSNVFDGQRLKVRLYHTLLLKEGFDVTLVDLGLLKSRIIRVLKDIKKNCKDCDCVVLLTANKGAEFLIPYINYINRKYKKRFILPLIGTSVLHGVLDRLSDEDKVRFLVNKEYDIVKRKQKMSRELRKIDLILPETDLISDAFKNFYRINNVSTLTNFRTDYDYKPKERKGFVFASRITKMKGIFNLFDAIQLLKNDGIEIFVDLFGAYQLNDEELMEFNNYLKHNQNISYKGSISPNNMIETLSSYEALLFPTLYLTEGVPGIIVESLIAGTPVISSSFPQSYYILTPKKDSLLFELNNPQSLANTIKYFIKNNCFNSLSKGAVENGKKYLYSHNKRKFLEAIKGTDSEEEVL